MTNAAVGMPCPVCRVPLTMSERQGVEIDYCPQCRGVWLDRGELDKILERAARDTLDANPPPPPPPTQQPWGQQPTMAPPSQGYSQPHPQPYAQGYDQSHGHQGGYGKHGYPKRKKSFLENLFD